MYLMYLHDVGAHGAWLVDCDVDARDGRGTVQSTTDPRWAKRFETPTEALTYLQRSSQVKPLRQDGRPNRPLTSYTVTILPSEKAFE